MYFVNEIDRMKLLKCHTGIIKLMVYTQSSLVELTLLFWTYVNKVHFALFVLTVSGTKQHVKVMRKQDLVLALPRSNIYTLYLAELMM